MISVIQSLLRKQESDTDLALAQFRTFSKQIPLLYFVLLANMMALSWTHWYVAPVGLTLIIPGILFCISIVRLLVWWRPSSVRVSSDQALRRLRFTLFLVVVLGASFVTWALSLYPYGDAYHKSHVAFFIATTVISCIFCLTHMRAAALTLTAITMIPFTVFFATTGNQVFVAMAIDLILVVVAMVITLITHARDFADLIHTQNELTDRQAQTQELSDENLRLANMDSLAGIPNRRSFFAELQKRLDHAKRDGTALAVAIADLDGFKPINDAFGHLTGDKVLQVSSSRLSRAMGPNMFVARLGGDEFGIIIEGERDKEALQSIAEDICQMLSQPIVFPDISVEVAGSMGVATFPEAGQHAQTLFERADYVLYHAKQHRRGRAVLFSTEHARDLTTLSQIKHELHSSRWEEEITVHFQPMIDSDNQRILGFEALARWDSSRLGPIRPDVFIDVAERSGIIHRLTEVLFSKALAAATTWPDDIRLSFNLSARDVASRPVMERLCGILARSDFDAHRLEVEITETSMMRDFSAAQTNLRMLTSLGAQIALDDFGTGYSSLSYLHRLSPDMVKVDRSFILDIETNPISRDIVKSLLDLAHNVGCECVVEGVESVSQVLILRNLGCRLMQGFYFSKPMPEDELQSFVAAHASNDAAGGRTSAANDRPEPTEATIVNLPSAREA